MPSYGGIQPSRIFDEHVVGDAPGAHVVLERDRHAGERARVVAAGDGSVDLGGAVAGIVGEHQVEGVDLALGLGDRRQVLLEHVDGGQIAAADTSGDLAGGRELAHQRHHPGSAAPGSDRLRTTVLRQHFVAVERRAAGTSSRSTLTSGYGCVIGSTSPRSSASMSAK